MSTILTDGPIIDATTIVFQAHGESQSSRRALECNDSFCFTGEDSDFTPTAHPHRELFTASLVGLVILTFVVWGGWTLIPL